MAAVAGNTHRGSGDFDDRFVDFCMKGLKRNRERAELESKLEQFGLPIPWADRD